MVKFPSSVIAAALLFVSVTAFALPLPAESAADKAIDAKSINNAKQLVFACKAYAIDNNGSFPKTLDDLFPTYLNAPEILVSPLNPKAQSGYIYHPGFTDTSPAGSIIIEDKFAPKLRHHRIVIHLDGSAGTAPSK